ncbi:hypothetical protein BRYFOR_06056 [Marvinbryantia formatexigens DSM 14469]|uniref:Flagellin N-methylase n=2 Tax=Marvinbryantia TaxID=248744 RepID=C6LBR1_9FIRM|nr:hypothetical protein BRYFOR_06056 [Marvinbryantia formatexigens DSM 14469]
MGESIVLDPLDVWRLEKGLDTGFAGLMERFVELHPVDGILLPNLRMEGEAEKCPFLNEEKRCAIHAFRPGLCRLFPLGRIYENGSFRYFIQQQECPVQPKTKVKISKWLDIGQLAQYETFVLQWHNLLEETGAMAEAQKDEQLTRDLNVYLLESFYQKPYDGRDFYVQFEERLQYMRKLLKILGR